MSRLAALAHHYCAALPGGDPRKAADYAQRAAEHADQLFAYEEAARYCRLALQALDAKGGDDDPARRCRLLIALGRALVKTGENLQAAEVLLQERSPHLAPLDHPPEEHKVEEAPGRTVQSRVRRYVTPHTVTPRAHLLSNGDLGSIILFGSFLGWAVYDRIAVKRREAAGEASKNRIDDGGWTNDVIALAVGTLVYFALAYTFHPAVIGVPVFGG